MLLFIVKIVCIFVEAINFQECVVILICCNHYGTDERLCDTAGENVGLFQARAARQIAKVVGQSVFEMFFCLISLFPFHEKPTSQEQLSRV